MIIYSELLKETFNTVDECLEAEAQFAAEELERQEKEKAHKEACDKAYEEAIAACDRYLELVGLTVCEENEGEDEEVPWETRIAISHDDLLDLIKAIFE